ncbi:MAG: hypothetical protein QHH26_03025 [Armatimonadota bacterium]|nr:hypothetical protein [Armatimonadota bacterium]
MDSARFDRIRSAINEIPVIDIHTHLGTRGMWQARDLTDIMFYHWLGTEFRNAGCPEEACYPSQTAPALTPKERVKTAIPFCRAIRNTSNFWAFAGIMSDLYGIDYLDESNWEYAFDAVAERANDPTWELEVLRRAKIKKAAIHAGQEPRDPSPYFNYLLGEGLYGIGLVTTPEALTKTLGELPQSALDLDVAITKHIEKTAQESKSTAIHLWLPATWRYTPTELDEANELFKRWKARESLSQEERNRLSSFSADVVAREAGRLGLVVQVFHGSIAYSGGLQVTTWHPGFLRNLILHIAKNAATKFDLFLATRAASHEAAGLARLYPNLIVSGAWWHGFTPTTLTEFFRDRLEMLPMTRWHAFYSDGYCVEWCYGKLLLTKNRLAVALTQLADEHLIGEEDVEEIAQALLYDNPMRIYLANHCA